MKTLAITVLVLALATSARAQSVPFDTLPSWVSTEEGFTRDVAWGDVDGDGDLDLACAQDSIHPVRIYYNKGDELDSRFGWQSDDSSSGRLAWGDVNGDGFLDLACGCSVYMNHNGLLERVASWRVDGPSNVRPAWGDFDGDGDVDLACGSRLFENVDGVLRRSPIWTATDSTGDFATWGDIDNDGDLDLLCNGRLYLNRGGLLDSVADWVVPFPVCMCNALGDLDGNEYMDACFGFRAKEGETSIAAFMNFNGMFQSTPSSTRATSEEVRSIVIADLDGDHRLDIVHTDYPGFTQPYRFRHPPVTVIFNDTLANRTWSVQSSVSPARGFPGGIAIADVDGDNDLDLAVGNSGVLSVPDVISLYKNKKQWFRSDSSMVYPILDSVSFLGDSTSGLLTEARLVDVDRDGTAEILSFTGYRIGPSGIGSMRLSVTPLIAGVPVKSRRRDIWTVPDAYRLTTGDANGDGFPEVAIVTNSYFRDGTRYFPAHSTFLLANDTGDYRSEPIWSGTREYAMSLGFADVNGDGDDDLAVGVAGLVSGGGQRSRVYLSNGSTLDSTPIWFSEPQHTQTISWADVDGDGDPDLMLGTLFHNQLYMNHGGILDTLAGWTSTDYGTTMSMTWGDVDGDGDLDLASGELDQPFRIYENLNGRLEQEARWNSSETAQFSRISLIDIDQDGDLDFVCNNNSHINHNGKISPDPSWTFEDSVNTIWGPVPVYQLEFADINEDGALDMVGYYLLGVKIYLNTMIRAREAEIGLPNLAPELRDVHVLANDHASGQISVELTVKDREGDPCILSGEVSPIGGGYWVPASLVGVSNPIASSPAGTHYVVTWDAERENISGSSVVLRLKLEETPRRGGDIRWPATRYDLNLGKMGGPPFVAIEFPPDSAVVSGSVPVIGRAWSATGQLSLEFLMASIEDTTRWTLVGAMSESFRRLDRLSTIDLNAFQPGQYVLRSRAVGSGGQTRLQERRIRVADHNDTAPRVSAVFPRDSMLTIPQNAPVVLQFDRPLSPDAVTATTFRLANDKGLVGGNVFYDAPSRTVILDPTNELDGSAFYYTVVDRRVVSQAGFQIGADHVSTFGTSCCPVTGDVLSISPSRGFAGWEVDTAVTVNYSRQSAFRFLSVSSVGNIDVIKDTLSIGTDLTASTRKMRLKPKTLYLIRVSDTPEFNGPDDFMSYFITEDVVRPWVVSTAPQDGELSVPRNTSVSITFNKAMNVFSIDSSSFYLIGKSGMIPGLITFSTDDSGTTATLSPLEALSAGSDFRVVLTSHIQDYTGRALDSTSFTFSTAAYFSGIPPSGGEVSIPGLRVIIPPGSFEHDTEVRANRVPGATALPAINGADYLGIAYDVLSQFTPLRPAVLRISLDTVTVPSGTTPEIYRTGDSVWKYLGGTYDRTMRALETVTDSFGRFAVFAVSATSSQPGEALSSLTLAPRAFSPVGGSFQRELSVGFTLAQPGPATVKVYNLAGRLVRVLADNQWMSSGSNVVTWSGQDYDGSVVPSGLYVVTVEAAGRSVKNTVAVVNQ